MKQFQFGYENYESFRKQLKKINQWCSMRMVSNVVFHIFSETLNYEKINMVCDVISAEMPDSIYLGSSTNGNIMGGRLAKESITITCTVYEQPTTKLELIQYELNEKTESIVSADIKKKIEERPWVKAVEMLLTIRGMSMTNLCEHLSEINEDVQIFGGGAFTDDINSNAACVFSKNGKLSDRSIVFMLMGGEDLHIMTDYVTGWKPLGKDLHITKVKESTLYELDNRPAYETYYKYLHINNDEAFFFNTLEFPFFFNHNGIDLLRAPTQSNPDGSLTMTADMYEGDVANIAYGDPWTILDSVKNCGHRISHFRPDELAIYSCAARRTYWGSDEVSKELGPFQSIAPTYGFFTSGEFLRTGRNLNQHNVTLVIAAIREGDVDEKQRVEFEMEEEEHSGKVSMISRLATFIAAATKDLEEAKEQLEEMAVTDALTKLYNRGEIQRQINDAVAEWNENNGRPVSLVMLDIDDFKAVNDTYGHDVGDEVLKKIGSVLRKYVVEFNERAKVGRWGGEEFMVLLPGIDRESATMFAEGVRTGLYMLEHPGAGHKSVSVGVISVLPGESPDSATKRVDEALYRAKKGGKNRVESN